ncbi:VIT1/CCC1 transporter family protein [bacterium]|nr:VIT1/CCC1 transporter family protein [bacterium]
MLVFQRNEITEHHIYKRLADSVKNPKNRQILLDISEDERRHAFVWKNLTHREVGPDRLKIWFYYWAGRIFGFTFSIRLMERGEDSTQEAYERLAGIVAGIDSIMKDENEHEAALIGLLDEERLKYMGSVVLGLNDALVELTGSLAGLTLALGNSRLIALTGLIVGFAAALSMGASEYLSTRTEKNSGRDPLKSSLYTGVAYLVTVAVLILPFLTLDRPLFSLALALAAALLIIAVFNFYLSVARDESFRLRFLEMAGVSLGVAAVSFGIGCLVRVWLGIEI